MTAFHPSQARNLVQRRPADFEAASSTHTREDASSGEPSPLPTLASTADASRSQGRFRPLLSGRALPSTCSDHDRSANWPNRSNSSAPLISRTCCSMVTAPVSSVVVRSRHLSGQRRDRGHAAARHENRDPPDEVGPASPLCRYRSVAERIGAGEPADRVGGGRVWVATCEDPAGLAVLDVKQKKWVGPAVLRGSAGQPVFAAGRAWVAVDPFNEATTRGWRESIRRPSRSSTGSDCRRRRVLRSSPSGPYGSLTARPDPSPACRSARWHRSSRQGAEGRPARTGRQPPRKDLRL